MSEDLRTNQEILFIDDSRTAVALASKMLGEQYTVHCASNGEEAWGIIENNPAVTLVFTDMHMPVMNGMELLIKIRKSDNPRIARLPVVMVTGKTDTEAGRRAVFDIGATDFIGKPFTALDLLLRVRAHTVQPTKRATANKELGGNLEMLVSPSAFHSLGCQALEYAYEKRTEFTVVFIELSNYEDLKEEVGDKNVKQMIIAIAVRLSNIIREEDVATRIGENKFAVLLFTENKYANASAKTLYKNLRKQEFLFNDRVIIPVLTYGQASVDVSEKITFQEMCVSADQSLQKASSSLPVNNATSPRFPARKYSNKDLDLWAAIKYVIDGEYDLVPDKHREMLVKCMESYLVYAATKH